ncbi:MAG TPA: PEP-CTERM sorting domain-containing protein, partial [Chthoniobacteraceae bacterium]|nr:PEP-CTERM sorting domain-containing protein [Chthoniobacteraceae bacterium]
PAGVDVSQAYIAGVWASDNNGIDIVLNGQSAGYPNALGFAAFSPQWVVARGFVPGTNTLDFIVNEATGSAGAGGYSGVRVEMTGAAPVPGRFAIPGLKNSGVAAPEGLPLADDAPDPGVVLTGATTGPAIVARAIGGFPIPPWAPDNNQSAWLTPGADTNGPDGDYAYTITFDLTGFDPSSVSILGRWAVDNVGSEILLNGQPTGNENGGGFADYTPFSISSSDGDLFSPGVNTLSFQVNNATPPGPTGVRWEFLSATVAIPEPASVALFLAAVAMFGTARGRRTIT